MPPLPDLATLVALVANGPVVALIVLAAVILVNQLEGNFLQPVVMAQTLNACLVILMALTAGTVLAEIIGAVLAVHWSPWPGVWSRFGPGGRIPRTSPVDRLSSRLKQWAKSAVNTSKS